MDGQKDCNESECVNTEKTDNGKKLNPDMVAELRAKLKKEGKTLNMPEQNSLEVNKEGLISKAILEDLKKGAPAIVITDNGQNVGCFVQRLSKPAIIGILNIFHQTFLQSELKGSIK